MPSKNVTITAVKGLHARPAGLLVTAAREQPVDLTITTVTGQTVSAVSILAIIGLGVRPGDVLTIGAEGIGAEAAIDVIVEMLSGEFD